MHIFTMLALRNTPRPVVLSHSENQMDKYMDVLSSQRINIGRYFERNSNFFYDSKTSEWTSIMKTYFFY